MTLGHALTGTYWCHMTTQPQVQRTHKPGQTNRNRRPLSGYRTLSVHG